MTPPDISSYSTGCVPLPPPRYPLPHQRRLFQPSSDPLGRFCRQQEARVTASLEAAWQRYVHRLWAAQPNEGTRTDWVIERRW